MGLPPHPHRHAVTPTPYPLQWPAHRPRTKVPSPSKFVAGAHPKRHHSLSRVLTELGAELSRYGVSESDIVVSTNIPLRLDGRPRGDVARPQDTGAAVYFRRRGVLYVVACDRWNRVECNLWAIAHHIEGLRASERWGVETAESALASYLALPAKAEARQWWHVLGFDSCPTPDAALKAYRDLRRRVHPDVPETGNVDRWHEIQQAFGEAEAYFQTP